MRRSRAPRRVAHAFHRRSRRWARDVQAVSPVIGTVLILFIVLVAMAGIMLWGVPAIQELQEQAEFQSVLSQVVQINAEIRAMRDANAARAPGLTMNHGSIDVEPGSRWVVTYYRNDTFKPTNITGWEDDASLSALVDGHPKSVNITLDRALGGTFQSKATVNDCTTNCVLTYGAYALTGNTTRILVKQNSTVEMESWIFDAGRMTYRMDTLSDFNRIHVEMGGVFTQQGEALFREEKPTIKEPLWDLEPKDTSYLVRALQVEGDSSVSGKGRYTIQPRLLDTYGVTRARPSVDTTWAVRIQIDDSGLANSPGLLEEAYCNHFISIGNYTQQGDAGACDEGDVNVLFDPDDVPYSNSGVFRFDLTQSVVSLTVRS